MSDLVELRAGLQDVIRWIRAKDPLATNFIYVQQAIDEIDRHRAQPSDVTTDLVRRLRERHLTTIAERDRLLDIVKLMRREREEAANLICALSTQPSDDLTGAIDLILTGCFGGPGGEKPERIAEIARYIAALSTQPAPSDAMVEAGAKAICFADGNDGCGCETVDDCSGHQNVGFMRDARACLTAALAGDK